MNTYRTAIPALMWLAVPLWIACALGMCLVPEVGYRIEPLACLAAAFLLVSIVCGIAYARLNVPSALMLATVGTTLGFLLALDQSFLQISEENSISDFSGSFCVQLLSDPVKGSFSDSAQAVVEGVDGTKAKTMIEAKSLDGLMCNDRAWCVGRYAAPTIGNHRKLWLKGCVGTLKLSSFEERESAFPFTVANLVRQSAISTMEEQGASSLVMALSCGLRQDLLASSAYTEFKSVGLAHLVAVSGAHLMIVTALFSSALKALRVPRRFSFIMLVFMMVAYLVLSGIPISAVRACIMTAIGLASFTSRRRSYAFNALALALIVIIVHDPSASVSVSLALSVLSTMGILLFARLLESWFSLSEKGSLLIQQLGISLSASIFSMPLSCSLFAMLPLVTPLANVAAAPLFAPCCAISLLSALASCMNLPVSMIFIELANMIAGILEQIVAFLSRIPYGCIPVSIDSSAAIVLSIAIGTLLWFFWPQGRRGAIVIVCSCAITVLAVVFIRVPLGDSIVTLDVGQGEAILIQSDNASLLVDTGTNDSSVLSGLARLGIYELDAIAITHADDDHCGSLEALGSCMIIGYIILSEPSFSSESNKTRELVSQARSIADDVRGIDVGDVITIGRFSIVAISPKEFSDDGGNDDSLVLLVGYDPDDDGIMDANTLLTGDAEADVIERIVEEKFITSIDMIKAPHHGSRNGLSERLLEKLGPRIALISCGKDNRYGHPAQETLDLLDRYDVAVFRTDLQGDVVCSFGPEGINVTTAR